MCTDKTLTEKMRKIKWGDGCIAGQTSGMRNEKDNVCGVYGQAWAQGRK